MLQRSVLYCQVGWRGFYPENRTKSPERRIINKPNPLIIIFGCTWTKGFSRCSYHSIQNNVISGLSSPYPCEERITTILSSNLPVNLQNRGRDCILFSRFTVSCLSLKGLLHKEIFHIYLSQVNMFARSTGIHSRIAPAAVINLQATFSYSPEGNISPCPLRMKLRE